MRWLNRMFVDRHVYERRPTGARVVLWTRGAQLRLASFVGFLVLLLCLVGAAFAVQHLVLQRAQDRLALLEAASPAAPGASSKASAEGLALGQPMSQALADARQEIVRLQDAFSQSRRIQAEADAGRSGERATRDADLVKLREQRDTAEQQVKLMAEQLEAGQRRSQGMSEELADLRGQASEVSAARAALEQEVARRTEDLQARAKAAEESKRSVERSLRETKDRVAALEEQLGVDPAAAEAAGKEDPAALAIELALLRRERDAARGQLESAMETNADLQRDVAELKRSAPPSPEGTHKDLATLVPLTPGEQASYVQIIDELSGEIEDFVKQTAALELERDQHRTAAEGYARQLTAAEGKVAELEQQALAQGGASGQAEAELAKARADLETARSSVEDLRGQLAQVSAEKASLQASLETGDQAGKIDVARLEALEQEVGGLHAELQRVGEDRDALKGQLAAAQEAASLGAGADSDLGRLRDESQAKIAEFAKEAELLRRENATLSNNRMRIEGALEEQLGPLKDKISQLESQKATLEAKLVDGPPVEDQQTAPTVDLASALASTDEPAQVRDELQELDRELALERERRARIESYLDRFYPGRPAPAPRRSAR